MKVLSIDRMFAYIAVDENGQGEGIAAHRDHAGNWLPMVGADEERMKSLKPIAQALSDASNRRIVLARFEDRRDLEIIEPNPNGDTQNTIIVNPRPEEAP